MKTERLHYGVLPDGRDIDRIILSSDEGLSVSAITYGATITNILYRGKDVLLGYDSLADYLAGPCYQGATIGRYANRIGGGRFALNGRNYDVGRNEDGRGHLHGGWKGFDKHVWNAELLRGEPCPAVRFSCTFPDGDMGYPGRLDVRVTMRVQSGNRLSIQYNAVSDQDTVLNLTNHAYFNLHGFDGGDTLDTRLTIDADTFSPVDDQLVPTGENWPVQGTPFDFRAGKAIGRDIHAADPQLTLCGCFDHNFIINGSGMRRAARAESGKTGIVMECFTDQPCLQLYTSGGLSDGAGKGGIPLYRYQGFCLETQHFPDSPNQPAYPTTVLKKGALFESITAYAFSYTGTDRMRA